MSHQVLARKWRPRDFGSLIGQDHVVRALAHALTSGRLHHAYLFTGTRGVGKTTIARILAKALNCETGVSARPCGVCRACTEIDAGRFVDYIEMDAASNRGVDEMTQVLEAAVYSPSAGRYKVYVIDEVHMLSAHAFNAMLKTLEEPPGHVVFILATTDPQKVPVTVLSRCLQFNLKNMTPLAVAQHLAMILQAEAIAFEPGALPPIGRAAAGSMRDALSLLDQAIAFSGGAVTEAAVREMLGAVDRRYLVRIVETLLQGDGKALVAIADEMLANNLPFARTLDELASLLQRVALAQVGASADEEEAAMLQPFAQSIRPEDLQVYYQLVIHGARDLPLAPDEHAGFTMVLLRLLAFRPQGEGPRAPAAAPAPARVATRAAPAPAHQAAASSASVQRAMPAAMLPADSDAAAVAAVPFDGDWPTLAATLPVTGLALQFMQQSELIGHEGLNFKVRIPIRALSETLTVNKVREALARHFGAPVRLTVDVGQVGGTTAAAVASAQQAEKLALARASLEADPFVKTLLTEFDGRILPDSIRPQ